MNIEILRQGGNVAGFYLRPENGNKTENQFNADFPQAWLIYGTCSIEVSHGSPATLTVRNTRSVPAEYKFDLSRSDGNRLQAIVGGGKAALQVNVRGIKGSKGKRWRLQVVSKKVH